MIIAVKFATLSSYEKEDFFQESNGNQARGRIAVIGQGNPRLSRK